MGLWAISLLGESSRSALFYFENIDWLLLFSHRTWTSPVSTQISSIEMRTGFSLQRSNKTLSWPDVCEGTIRQFYA